MCHCPLSKVDDENVGKAEEGEMVANGVVLASVDEVDPTTLDDAETREEPEAIVEPVGGAVVDVAKIVEIGVVGAVGMVTIDGFSEEAVATVLVFGEGTTEDA